MNKKVIIKTQRVYLKFELEAFNGDFPNDKLFVEMKEKGFMIEYNVTEICTALYCYVRVI